MSYKSVRFESRDQQHLQQEVSAQAKELNGLLRLEDKRVLGLLQQMLWWDPRLRRTGCLPDTEKVALSLSYAMTHGWSIREIAQARKHNPPVTRKGVLMEKPPLDAPHEDVLAHLEAVKWDLLQEKGVER